jgi:putative tricarboxylic transport membrane protein
MAVKWRDVVSGTCLFLLGVFLFCSSFSIPKGAEMGLGADFMPKLISAFLVLCGSIIAVQGYRGLKKEQDQTGSPQGKTGAVILAAVLLGLFTILLNVAGFFIMSVLYIFAQTCLLAPKEKRNYILFGIIALAATALIYVVFVRFFKLMLPAGFLG